MTIAPFAGILTGPSNGGKTATTAAALGTSCLYVAGMGGLSVGAKMLEIPGLDRCVKQMDRPTLEEMADLCPHAAKKGFRALSGDDVTIAARNSYIDLKAKLPGKKNTAERYEQLCHAVAALATAARGNGLIACFNAHPRFSGIDARTGHWHVGGPDLMGWQVLPIIPAYFDASIAMLPAAGRWPRAVEFFADASWPNPDFPDWVVKDRYDVLGSSRNFRGPANLREYLRAAGVILPREPGLEWQEKVADRVADRILAGATPQEVWITVAEKLRGAYNPRHARWAIQDGIARAEYTDPILSDVLSLPPPPRTIAASTVGTVGTVAILDDDE